MSLVEEFKALAQEIFDTTGCPMHEAIREATATLYDLLGYCDDRAPLTIDNRVPVGVLRAVETWQEAVAV